jgi:hypothetical protein
MRSNARGLKAAQVALVLLPFAGQALSAFLLPALINYWTGNAPPAWLGKLGDHLFAVTVVCFLAAYGVGALARRVEERAAAEAAATDLTAGAVAAREEQWTRSSVLATVGRVWVDGVLGAARATLPAVDVNCTSAGSAKLPVGELIDRFCGGHGHLVLLGDIGTGKTYTLLRIAERLLDRAGADDNAPIPVVILMGDWRTGSCADFIEEQFAEQYKVPVHVSRAWLRHGRVLLLLDGVDDTPADRRRLGSDGLAEFLHSRPGTAAVLTCRTNRFPAMGRKITAIEAWRIRLPSPKAVESALTVAGEELRGFRDRLRADGPLRRAVGTPLTLSLAVRAYRNSAAGPITGRDGMAPQDQIFADFVDAAFGSAPAGRNVSVAGSRRGAAWLAANMRRSDLVSVRPESLQDSWLDGYRRPSVHADMPIRAVMRVLVVVAFVVLPTVLGIPGAPRSAELFIPVSAAVLATMTAYPLVRHFGGRIDLDQRTRFSRRVFGTVFLRRFPLYTAFILLSGAVLRLAGFDTGRLGIPDRLADPFVGGMLLGATLASFSAYQVAHRREHGERPHVDRSGLRSSARSATMSMVLTGALSAVPSWYVLGPGFGMSAAALLTVAMFDRNGGRYLIRHLLLRADLVANRLTPWQLRGFLDDLCSAGLLCRATTGYLFIHTAVRDRLAMEAPPAVRDSRPPAPARR